MATEVQTQLDTDVDLSDFEIPIQDVDQSPKTAENIAANPDFEQTERMVTYKGEHYPESQLRELCPHLAKLGDVAFKLIVEAHIKAEEKPTKLIETEETKTTAEKDPAGHQKTEIRIVAIPSQAEIVNQTARIQDNLPPAVTETLATNLSEPQKIQTVMHKELPPKPDEIKVVPDIEQPNPTSLPKPTQEISTEHITEIIDARPPDSAEIKPEFIADTDSITSSEIVVGIEPVLLSMGIIAEPEAKHYVVEERPETTAKSDKRTMDQEIIPIFETPINQFEVFMTSLPESMQPPTLESIQLEAEKLPIEEVFVMIARVIESTPRELTEELCELITEACEAVSVYLGTVELDPLTLPPEVIEKVVALLQYIGYENAEEALESYMTRRDLEFLVQTLRYLSQLKAEDNNQEFWQLFTNKKHLKLLERPRLGKMLLQLIGVHEYTFVSRAN